MKHQEVFSMPTEICSVCGDTCFFVAVTSNTDEKLWRCTECATQVGTSAMMAVAKLKAQIAAMQEDREEADTIRYKMGDILTKTANALKGPPKELSVHSWHDLAEVATAMQKVVDAARVVCDAIGEAEKNMFYDEWSRLDDTLLELDKETAE